MKPCIYSLIIPAFNEERKIGQDILMADNAFAERKRPYEIIVVNDGSTDRTASVLEGLKDHYPALKVIDSRPNRGKGYAVKQGVLASKGEIVLFADAGGCVRFEQIQDGLQLLKQGFDVVLASRRLDGARITAAQPLYRRIGSKVFLWMARNLMGLRFSTDTQCGFKLFQGDVARRIFAQNTIDGFMFDTETLARAQKQGCRIREFPVEWKNDPQTKFRPFSGSLRNLWELLLIKFRT